MFLVIKDDNNELNSNLVDTKVYYISIGLQTLNTKHRFSLNLTVSKYETFVTVDVVTCKHFIKKCLLEKNLFM